MPQPIHTTCGNRREIAPRKLSARAASLIVSRERLFATLTAAILSAALSGPAAAQDAGAGIASGCPASGADFSNPPELRSSAGYLKGTIYLSDERQRLTTSQGGTVTCSEQVVRNYRLKPPKEPRDREELLDPQPGPTLRARLGDVVQLTFVNQIDSGRFEKGLDLEECTIVDDGTKEIYPGTTGDTYPNCLHASSTANLHFHGTHTNPNATGDNVYLQIRPLPRDNQGRLTTTAAEATEGFEDYFGQCAAQLRDPLNSWPATWGDVAGPWTDRQAQLLKAYQQRYPSQPLWNEDAKVLSDGGWPIYYVGAFPYCFALPAYRGHGMAPVMGQAPGTQWYHAHKHGSTATNVLNGMTGAFIVEGAYDDELNAAYGSYGLEKGKWDTRSQPVLVLNQLGTVLPLLTGGGSGKQDPDFMVNGQLRPKMKMQPGEVQLWRIVNASGRTALYFMPPEGLEWRQLAQDGVQLDDANYQASLNKPFFMAPANRVDLLVKAPMTSMSAEIRVQQIVARDKIAPTPAAPSSSDPVPGVALLKVEVGGPSVTLNGKPAEMNFLATAPTQPALSCRYQR